MLSENDFAVYPLSLVGNHIAELHSSILYFVKLVEDNASMRVIRSEENRHLLDILRFVWQSSV